MTNCKEFVLEVKTIERALGRTGYRNKGGEISRDA
jgi:hypothetical protein